MYLYDVLLILSQHTDDTPSLTEYFPSFRKFT